MVALAPVRCSLSPCGCDAFTSSFWVVPSSSSTSFGWCCFLPSFVPPPLLVGSAPSTAPWRLPFSFNLGRGLGTSFLVSSRLVSHFIFVFVLFSCHLSFSFSCSVFDSFHFPVFSFFICHYVFMFHFIFLYYFHFAFHFCLKSGTVSGSTRDAATNVMTEAGENNTQYHFGLENRGMWW